MKPKKLKNGDLSYRPKVYIDGKAITKVFRRKSDAIAWKQRVTAERDRNKALGVPNLEDIHFDKLANRWIKSKSHLASNTIRDYKGVVNKYLLPHFKNQKISKISYGQIQHFVSNLSECEETCIGKSRINKIIKVIKMVFSFAVELEHIYKSPADKLNNIKVTAKEIVYWDESEVAKFLSHNRNNYYYDLYLFALSTGLRLGEIVGLKWDCVLFSEGRIVIKRIMTRDGMKDETKGKKDRSVFFSPDALSTLQSRKEKSLSEFVFTKEDNISQVSYEHFTYRVFRKAVEESGVKKIYFKHLRSTFATSFCKRVGDIYVLSGILGHSSVAITQKHYAHLCDSSQREAMQKLSIKQKDSTFLAHQNLLPFKRSFNSIG
ncbi:MAG: site-specific integrase [Bacteriovoracaceae bacterium]|jgi:integrase|nr:site-specific integrase [Bacteriovoracaceae bacterium]